jgi:hypothetical protein
MFEESQYLKFQVFNSHLFRALMNKFLVILMQCAIDSTRHGNAFVTL